MKSVVEILFPRRCPFCKGLLHDASALLCEDCRRTLPWTGERCWARGAFFEGCVSPLFYAGEARQALLRFKFSGKSSYSLCFGGLIADCVSAQLRGQFDAICYVPVDWLRLRQRGYSQSRLLAKELSRLSGVPCRRLLRKRRRTKIQSHLRGEGTRQTNVSGAYAAVQSAELAGLRLLLVDDVVTTGATLSECSRVLLAAGAKRVLCATLCRAEFGRSEKA